MTEDEQLRLLHTSVDLAFIESDPYFRDFFTRHLMSLKWKIVTLLQSGT